MKNVILIKALQKEIILRVASCWRLVEGYVVTIIAMVHMYRYIHGLLLAVCFPAQLCHQKPGNGTMRVYSYRDVKVFATVRLCKHTCKFATSNPCKKM